MWQQTKGIIIICLKNLPLLHITVRASRSRMSESANGVIYFENVPFIIFNCQNL